MTTGGFIAPIASFAFCVWGDFDYDNHVLCFLSASLSGAGDDGVLDATTDGLSISIVSSSGIPKGAAHCMCNYVLILSVIVMMNTLRNLWAESVEWTCFSH